MGSKSSLFSNAFFAQFSASRTLSTSGSRILSLSLIIVSVLTYHFFFLFFTQFSQILFFACFYASLLPWNTAWKIRHMTFPTINTLHFDIKTDFSSIFCTTSHSTLIVLDFVCSSTDDIFCWLVPITSYLLQLIPQQVMHIELGSAFQKLSTTLMKP